MLPGVLEELEFAERGRDLLRAPGVVAIEPARWRPRGEIAAANLSRRLSKRLPGRTRVVIVLHPGEYLLGRALVARGEDAELWYGPEQERYEGRRLAELDALARRRAALVFSPARSPEQAAFQDNAALWERLEALRVAVR